MTVYAESNFLLHWAFQQEDKEHCQAILGFAKETKIDLVLPAYSLGEILEKLQRQKNERKKLGDQIRCQLQQLARNPEYKTATDNFEKVLNRSVLEEQQRCQQIRQDILQNARLIPLTKEILKDALTLESSHGFSSQDAIIYASVKSDLISIQPTASNRALFINSNAKDFNRVKPELNGSHCDFIASFKDAHSKIQSKLGQPGP